MMPQHDNLLDQFDNIPELHGTEAWKGQLLQRIGQEPAHSRTAGSPYIMAAVLFCLLINVVSVTMLWTKERRLSQRNDLQQVASEFFINSISSPY